ncbi:MAG: hypothetical protein ACE148_07140 [Vicinamibacterales bacterium]
MKQLGIFALAFFAAFALAAPVAFAQEQVTVVKKSGERISGQLVDLNAGGFALRVDGQERQIPKGDVAVIEFGSSSSFPAGEVSQVSGDQGLLVLRNGQVHRGTLYDVGGTQPLRITFQIGSEQRDFQSSEVARIYLARPDQAVPTTGQAQPPSAGPGVIRVMANQQWTPANLTVRRGQIVRFESSGEITLSQDANDKAQPAGSFNQRYAENAPLPRAFAGALIGRIGNGEPFAIGNQAQVTMPASGPLFLGINDDHVGDNGGYFTVRLMTGSAIRR